MEKTGKERGSGGEQKRNVKRRKETRGQRLSASRCSSIRGGKKVRGTKQMAFKKEHEGGESLCVKDKQKS